MSERDKGEGRSVMITEMKDSRIENAFRNYFAGLEAPRVDLAAVKAALAESREGERRAKRRRRTAVILSAVSACACALVAVILTLLLLPAASVTRFSLSSADARTVSYTELREEYAETGYVTALSRFSLASNASAEYTVYTVDGREVMLEADLSLAGGFSPFRAKLLIDLSGGTYRAEETERYAELRSEGDGYRRYETERVDGEYLSLAYLEGGTGDVFAEVVSPSKEALSYFMRMLTAG